MQFVRLFTFTMAISLLQSCGQNFENYLAPPDAAAMPRQTSSWPMYGGPGAAKFAPLSQITALNVAELEPAWTHRTGEMEAVFQATPIIVGGRLVFCTPRNRVIALDPLTGAGIWQFDPEIQGDDFGNETNCRAVAQWQGDIDACPVRVFTATNDARLIALDAATGQRCTSFGKSGEIDLKEGVGELAWPGEYQVTSPPAVVGDVVVVGAAISDNQRANAPSGVVRGFNARTGELAWAFDMAPPGFDYSRHPVSDAGYALATPNVWTAMAVDETRDMVFLPTGNPAPDYFRPVEPDMDFYGSAVVALRGSTGEYLWHFNTVINDFWDFDLPSAPSLVDLEIAGKTVPALIQSTKMGFVFVLHRETGEPLVDVEYLPVPVEGPLASQLSPVQPFPPEAFQLSRRYSAEQSLLGLCSGVVEENVSGPVYTPITERWTIGLPSNMGATNWGGVAVDGARGLIAARTSHVPFRTKLIKRSEAADIMAVLENSDATLEQREAAWETLKSRFDLPDDVEVGPQRGTDYLMARHIPYLGTACLGLPLGEVVVLDIAGQRQQWRQPHGWDGMGLPGVGGPLLTETGLLFAAGMMESAIYAYDVETGVTLWNHELPAPGNATPMSYEVVDEQGALQQFVVIAAGGDSRSPVGSRSDYLVAFALPVKSK